MNIEDWTRVRAGLRMDQCPPAPEWGAVPECPSASAFGYPCWRPEGHTGRHYAAHSGRVVAVWR